MAEKMAGEADTDKVFTLAWVPGHCGIQGNELADGEAKEATKNGSSGELLLPLYLRKPLPASVAAIKQHFQTTLMSSWQSRLENSPRYQRITRIEEDGTRSKFMRETVNMGKRQTSMVVQLRSGHIPLNQYLHRIHKSDTPNCPHCSMRGRQIPETVKHFIIECPAYAKERSWLRGKLGREAYSMKAMFTKEKAIRILIGFVDRTRRLKNNFGDVTIT